MKNNEFSWNVGMKCQMKVHAVVMMQMMLPLIERLMYQRYSTLNLNKIIFHENGWMEYEMKSPGDMITFDMKLKCERLMYWRYAMVKIDWINFSESDVKSAQLRKNKL